MSNTVQRRGLSLSDLQAVHELRQAEWCPDQQPDLSFRGNELAGEVGEACNVIKKLERERHGWRGSRASMEDLKAEVADVIHCATLVAITAGFDLERAVISKFNETSQKNELRAKISTRPLHPVDVSDLDEDDIVEAYEKLNKLDNSDLYHVGQAYRRMAEGNLDEAMEILSRHFDLAPPHHERAIADLLTGKRN
ncbi:MazG-like family protein [Agrobacterium tumefaciens]|uniref:MazG-like family protein n=1 Tax=Agrobacterium tumefaciens TaxID=358 RepID=UPI003BA0059A